MDTQCSPATTRTRPPHAPHVPRPLHAPRARVPRPPHAYLAKTYPVFAPFSGNPLEQQSLPVALDFRYLTGTRLHACSVPTRPPPTPNHVSCMLSPNPVPCMLSPLHPKPFTLHAQSPTPQTCTVHAPCTTHNCSPSQACLPRLPARLPTHPPHSCLHAPAPVR